MEGQPPLEPRGVPLFDISPPIVGTLVKIQSIGSSGYSEVWRGAWQDGKKDVPVGIKCIRLLDQDDLAAQQRFEQRIRREALIWQSTAHENILPFIGYQVVDGETMLVSPWCEMGNLKEYLSTPPDLRDSVKLKLLRDGARGLEHLHTRDPPIVHANIKPENVMITGQGKAALTDFGISGLIGGFGVRTGLTSAGGASNAGYQALELLEDNRPTDKSDVYSFGGLILSTMTGEPAFWQYFSDALTVRAMIQGQVPQPADHTGLSEDDLLWELMRQCWNIRPNQRPSMRTIVAELTQEIWDRT